MKGGTLVLRVALIGNPNVGKSVIFNNLTGLRQHTGNWPGKTVEKKVGRHTYKGVEMEIVDLPGTYSLTSRAIDELIAREYIVEEKPDVVVDIVDASNIERNLYLTVLLL
ncbi:MAG: FeoB small GTPase domain-containing protein, partial [Candidatus Freyarchaeota archaeon]